ncbi:unnamed protein product [Penicillium manginii]
MWAGFAKSFGSLLAARIFMGIAVAPADTSKHILLKNYRYHLMGLMFLVAPNVIGEIYFTHQRGRAMGVYTVCICLGPIIGGLSGGYIAGNKGLPWIHWVNVILSAILFVFCLVFVPETLYSRKKPLISSQVTDLKGNTETVEDVAAGCQNGPRKSHPLLTSMLKFHKHDGEIWSKFLAPWKTLRLPGVWLVMFWYAGLVGGVVTITTVAPTLVSKPPYLWGNNAGLIMIGGIIGAFLGFLTTSLSADRIITSKRVLQGDAFVEPEARLPVAIPGLVLATTGLWTFGFCAQSTNPHMWIGMQFGTGMLCFGLMQAPSVGFNYVSQVNR